jgi:hypothetical protein
VRPSASWANSSKASLADYIATPLCSQSLEGASAPDGIDPQAQARTAARRLIH